MTTRGGDGPGKDQRRPTLTDGPPTREGEGSRSRPVDGLPVQVVLPDLLEELAAADAQPFGGAGAVAGAGEEGAADRAALDLGEQGPQGEDVGRLARGEALDGLVGVEVLG